MSYILDALKKSEGERERDVAGELPDWQTSHSGDYTPTPQAATKQQKITIAVLSGILVVLVTGIVIWNLNQQTRTPVVAEKATAPTVVAKSDKPKRMSSAEFAASQAPVDNKASNKTTKTTFEKFAEVQNDANNQTPVVKKSPPVKAKPAQVKKQPTQVAKRNPRKGSVVFSDKPLAQNSTKIKAKPKSKRVKVVTVADLPKNIRRAIPPIGFSGHVYSSEDPKQSSVMINGKKMKEGQNINTELKLEKITEAGAQFGFRGYHFSLGALQDWQGR